MTWIADAAKVFTGGREDRCEAGHERHALMTVDVRLGERPVPDCPASVPLRFWFDVFAAQRYADFPGYCSGDDELSRAVLAQGCWEPWETALALCVLAGDDEGDMLDVGSHVGWYTTLAALAGRRVLAVDAEAEHLHVLGLNAEINGVAKQVVTARGWVDDTREPLPTRGARLRLVKVDVEGQEVAATAMLGDLLDLHRVEYALVELSPEFGDGRGDVVERFAAAGYASTLVPDKGDDIDAFEADPLGFTLKGDPVPEDLAVQRTALFWLP